MVWNVDLFGMYTRLVKLTLVVNVNKHDVFCF